MGTWFEEAMARNAQQPVYGQAIPQMSGGMMPSLDQVPQIASPYFGVDAPTLDGFSISRDLESFDPMAGMNVPGSGPSFMDSAFGYTDADKTKHMGWGSALLDLGKAGLQGYLGLEQLGLAKDNLQFQKDSFSKQFENQRSLTNTEMRDRQNARVASNPGAYQSTDEYMKNHGV